MKEQRKVQEQITEEQLPEAANESRSSAGETETPTLTGAVGHLLKWNTTTTLGDSSIREDSLNDVYFVHDIGLAGAVRTGVGVRFPDGSVQTTAAISAIAHDDTLAGIGTPAQPLGIAYVKHDYTLTGKGTSALPLGITIPLNLSGSTENKAILEVGNGGTGYAASFVGGDSGGGVLVSVRDSPDGGYGGYGIISMGGNCDGGVGGMGVYCIGGHGDMPGPGITAAGGYSFPTRSNGPAGRFFGDVEIYRFGGIRRDGNLLVSGTVTAGTGMFTIDHPLDPENKYLHHSAVESPEMMNVYNGNITTDAGGEAVVQLPDYFEAFNSDFRYQLTVIGQFAQAIVASEIKDNRFGIKTNAPNVKVSWQVTGIRQDAFAKAHAVKAEADKPAEERGSYLHPAEYGQPEEKGVQQVRHPELLRQIKEARDNAQQKSGQ